MNWKEIRREIDMLAELVDGWSASAEVPALERDLAMEQLRHLYESIRFCPPAAGKPEAAEIAASAVNAPMPAVADDPETVGFPEVLDLNELLNLGEEPSLSEEPGTAEEAALPGEPVHSGSSMASMPGSTELPVSVAETSAPESADGPLPVVPAAETSAPIHVEEAPAPVSTASTVIPSSPIVEPAASPAPALSPAAVPEPVAPVSCVKPKGAPTLFGEEETVRHRHKQRVIMSLYDSPAESESPARGTISSRSYSTSDPETSAMSFGLELDSRAGSAGAPVKPDTGVQDAFEPAVPHHAAPEVHAAEPTTAAGTVLGEVINHDVQTLADTIAPPRDMASELRRQEPVGDLRRAIGINDKFLLIRDLFDGNGAAYEQALDGLNACADLDDCMIFIAEHYAWNPESDGARLLMELLERKFS